jgi:hypothetical protein
VLLLEADLLAHQVAEVATCLRHQEQSRQACGLPTDTVVCQAGVGTFRSAQLPRACPVADNSTSGHELLS